MKKILTVFASLLTVIAALTVTPASWLFFIYQPKVPKNLLK